MLKQLYGLFVVHDIKTVEKSWNIAEKGKFIECVYKPRNMNNSI